MTNSLFPTVEDLGIVSVVGSVEDHDTALYVVGSGRGWVGKPGSEYNFLAESLAALFADRLELPTPACATGHTDEGKRLWLSSYLQFADHWNYPNDTSYTITNLEQLGGVLALDVLLDNFDRHAANVLILNEEFWAIDFGKSRLAMPALFEPTSVTRANGIYLDVPKHWVQDAAVETAIALKTWSDTSIRAIVSGACAVAGMASEFEDVYALCAERLQLLPELTANFLEEMR